MSDGRCAPHAGKASARGSLLLTRNEALSADPKGSVAGDERTHGLRARGLSSRDERHKRPSLSDGGDVRVNGWDRSDLSAFERRNPYDVNVLALFLDATFISVRPTGPKEGVLVARGFTDAGERILLAVTLGMGESYADWQALGRDLIARGLGAPMLIVADGAPGLTKAIEQCWPASDRQRCCVHRARNLYAKLPERERERSSTPTGRRWMTRSTRATASRNSRRWSPTSTRAATPPRPDAWPTIWTRSWCTCATHPGIVGDGEAPTCSSDPSARLRDAPK
jgi:hypothetical protein